MNEKLMQDIIIKYSSEILGEEGLSFVDREISTGTKRLDIILKDRRGRHMLVEAQIGSLDTRHIDRHIDFLEGYLEKNPDIDVRLVYVANKVDHLRKNFLDKRGYEYFEIPMNKFIDIAKKYNLITEENHTNELVISTLNSEHTSYISDDESQKRHIFISRARSLEQKEYWKLFFEEIDKRGFVKASFVADEFGVHIINPRHFNSSGGKYSLMFTRDYIFKMNNTSFQGKSWNGLGRMKNWCTTPSLPERFYDELTKRDFLSFGSMIDIETIVSGKSKDEIKAIIAGFFYCIDLFK